MQFGAFSFDSSFLCFLRSTVYHRYVQRAQILSFKDPCPLSCFMRWIRFLRHLAFVFVRIGNEKYVFCPEVDHFQLCVFIFFFVHINTSRSAEIGYCRFVKAIGRRNKIFCLFAYLCRIQTRLHIIEHGITILILADLDDIL